MHMQNHPKNHSYPVTAADRNTDLLSFLAGRLDLSRKRAKALLDERRVTVNRHPVWMARHQLKAGDCVETTASATESHTPNRPQVFRCLLETTDYLILDKPAGILTNGPNSMEQAVRTQRKEPGLTAVHRLDRGTSGCVLMARSPAAFEAAVELFKRHAVRKTYHAIALGSLDVHNFRITKPIDGQAAVSLLDTLDAGREASHLRVRIETGRTHQIRKHLESTGHPVAGDRQYGIGRRLSERTVQIARPMLHAARLEFVPSGATKSLAANAPLPADFKDCLRLFRLR
ncbi:MAG: hypothetical protein A2340_11360 [Lentisphaerae bacterium RIFOXYB12_FULL_60_10]|nr:MAG: hypothetical protein A2340_11360 [Lentisphaerae bacterium RIFOXYB12_FULL_60_10]